MRGVGVQADPAIATAIVTGKRIPHRGRSTVQRYKALLEPARRQAHIDGDGRRGIFRVGGGDQCGGGLGCQTDAGGRQFTDGKSRSEGGAIKEGRKRQGVIATPQSLLHLLPERGGKL